MNGMKPIHNYKMKPGLQKGKHPGVLSIHYDFLPFLLFDAKEVVKTHRDVSLYLRNWDKRVATLTAASDGLTYDVEMMTEEEYMEGVPGQIALWTTWSKEVSTEESRDRYAYLARVCESVMRCEYHTFMRELLGGRI